MGMKRPSVCNFTQARFASFRAHFNPAVTLVIALRGEIALKEGVAYVVAQIAGDILGNASRSCRSDPQRGHWASLFPTRPQLDSSPEAAFKERKTSLFWHPTR
jgi:glycerol uptake facilitator-like aquaporin